MEFSYIILNTLLLEGGGGGYSQNKRTYAQGIP